jgi:hypothetical protein
MDGVAEIPMMKGSEYSVSVAGGAGDTTLTAAQAAKRHQKYTGALTGNRGIVAPVEFLAAGFEWIVKNETSGAFTLTFKSTSGSGVVVPQGYTAALRANGTDIVPVGPMLPASPSAYTVTNGTLDRTYDADTVAVAELADIVYSLITDLKAAKIVG